jgi:glycosyltransferase involved in cell wall biosynthesis
VVELISIIVATYNREDALEAVLRSLAGQTDRRFEVIVADDGSRPDTRELVRSFVPRMGVPLIHVWHEDQGFRLAEIRNQAILRSSGVICVFIDGDCIAQPNFVAVHRRLAELGWFVAGSRVLLGPAITHRVLGQRLRPELWPYRAWVVARLKGEINRLLPFLALPLGPLRKLGLRNWSRARGTNLAVRRNDLLHVDGFDAAYCGWGREDSDLAVRLIRSGVGCKDGRFASAVLHLWHPASDRSLMTHNEERLNEVISADRVRAKRGLSALGKPRWCEADRK